MYIIVDLNRVRINPDIYEVLLRLKNNDSRNNTINTKNNTLAIEAAPAAIPPKPKMAATIAIIKKLADQRNIELKFNGFKKLFDTCIHKILCHVIEGVFTTDKR